MMQAELISDPSSTLLAEIAEFAADCPGRTYLQEPDWPDYAPRKNKRHGYAYAVVRDAQGALVLTGILRRTSMPLGLGLGAFRRGPLTRTVADLPPAMQALMPVLRKHGLVSVTLNPRWMDEEAAACEAALTFLGARKVAPARQTLHGLTGLIDLSRPTDEILAGLSKTCRKTIRGLAKKGISVRPLEGDAEIALYKSWNAEFNADRGLNTDGIPTPEEQVAHARAHGGTAAVVEVNGEITGVFIGFRDGDRILPIANGWANPKDKLPRNYIMFWHLIETAKANGIRYLDVGGLTDPDAERGGEMVEAGGAAARDQFKMHFAPQVVRLTDIHEIVLRPLAHKAVMTAKKAA